MKASMFQGGLEENEFKEGFKKMAPDGYETVPDFDCHPDCPIRMLDEQSGVSPGSHNQVHLSGKDKGYSGKWYAKGKYQGHNDSGGASRFFKILDE